MFDGQFCYKPLLQKNTSPACKRCAVILSISYSLLYTRIIYLVYPDNSMWEINTCTVLHYVIRYEPLGSMFYSPEPKINLLNFNMSNPPAVLEQ